MRGGRTPARLGELYGRTGAPRRPRSPRRSLEARPRPSRCGPRPTPSRLDWPPGRWPVGWTRSTWLRTRAGLPAGAIDRCGPTDESWT